MAVAERSQQTELSIPYDADGKSCDLIFFDQPGSGVVYGSAELIDGGIGR